MKVSTDDAVLIPTQVACRTVNNWVWLQKRTSSNKQQNLIVKFTEQHIDGAQHLCLLLKHGIVEHQWLCIGKLCVIVRQFICQGYLVRKSSRFLMVARRAGSEEESSAGFLFERQWHRGHSSLLAE